MAIEGDAANAAVADVDVVATNASSGRANDDEASPLRRLLRLVHAAVAELSVSPTFLRAAAAAVASFSKESNDDGDDTGNDDEGRRDNGIVGANLVTRSTGAVNTADADMESQGADIVAESLLIRADFVDALLQRSAALAVLSSEPAAAEYLAPLSPRLAHRWPPYPVLRARFRLPEGGGEEGLVSPGHVDEFELPPPGTRLKVPNDPRKAYDDALATIEWGYWRQGIKSLAQLANIGFLPAKRYFDPTQSPLKNPTGIFHLSHYLHACGLIDVAYAWYRRAAEAGDHNAILELARFVRVGCASDAPDHDAFVRRDDGQAMAWFHRAWDLSGNADPAFAVGMSYATALDPTLPSIASLGNTTYDTDEDTDGGASSLNVLDGRDHALRSGLVSAADPPWATLDISMAAGKPVPRDYAKASFWLARAATLGHHGAECALGEIRLASLVPAAASASTAASVAAAAASPATGADLPTPQARRESGFRLLRRAAAAGVPRAMFLVGWCLVLGVGARVQDEEGRTWIEKAAAAGFTEPPGGSAVSMPAHFPSPSDPAGATELLSAAEQDLLVRGLRLVRLAADVGLPHAMFVLGLCLIRGLGLSRNVNIGSEWLTRAASAGWTDWPALGLPKVAALFASTSAALGSPVPAVGDLLGDQQPNAPAGRPIQAAQESHMRPGLTPHSTAITSKVSPHLLENALAAALAATGGSVLGGVLQHEISTPTSAGASAATTVAAISAAGTNLTAVPTAAAVAAAAAADLLVLEAPTPQAPAQQSDIALQIQESLRVHQELFERPPYTDTYPNPSSYTTSPTGTPTIAAGFVPYPATFDPLAEGAVVEVVHTGRTGTLVDL